MPDSVPEHMLMPPNGAPRTLRPYLLLSSGSLEGLQDLMCIAAIYGYRAIGSSLQTHFTEYYRECSICMFYPGFSEHDDPPQFDVESPIPIDRKSYNRTNTDRRQTEYKPKSRGLQK